MRGLDAIIFALPTQFLAHWGYLIVALAAILEVLPFLGSFIPGQTIVIISGFFAGIHIMRPGLLILVVIVGAIVGDAISYYLGKKYGYSFLIKYGKYVSFRREHYEKLKNLVLNNTGKTLIIGRFNPFSRSFAPFIAGASGVKVHKFLTYTVMGCIVWGLGSVLVGMIFGASYEAAAKVIGRFIAIATLIAIVLILVYRVINKKHNIFERYHIWTFVANILSLYVLAKLIDDIKNNESIILRGDIFTSSQIHTLWTPFWGHFMSIITSVFTPIIMLSAVTVLMIYFAYKRNWHNAVLMFLATSFACLTDLVLEIIMHRARPDLSLITAGGYSFPSGHAVLAALLFGFIILAFRKKFTDDANRSIFISVTALVGALIAFSRIYLNVHWLSDVVAGIAISVFWMTFWILVIKVIESIKQFRINQIERHTALHLLSSEVFKKV